MKRKTRGKGEGPNEIDILVGQRLRELRMLSGLSQSDLAATIGLTFQQLQKYERGVNRISASKLYQLSRHLNVPVSALFTDIESQRAAGPRPPASDTVPVPAGGTDGEDSQLRSREGLVLARHFMRIKDPEARSALKVFVEACAGITSTAPTSRPIGTRSLGANRPPSDSASSDGNAGERRSRRPRGVVWHPTDIGR